MKKSWKILRHWLWRFRKVLEPRTVLLKFGKSSQHFFSKPLEGALSSDTHGLVPWKHFIFLDTIIARWLVCVSFSQESVIQKWNSKRPCGITMPYRYVPESISHSSCHRECQRRDITEIIQKRSCPMGHDPESMSQSRIPRENVPEGMCQIHVTVEKS